MTIVKSRLAPTSDNDSREVIIDVKKKNGKLQLKNIAIRTFFFLKEAILIILLLQVVNKPMPTVTTEGKNLIFSTGLDRSPEAIKSFTSSAVSRLYSWSEYGNADKGVPLPSGKNIPYATLLGSLALSPEIQTIQKESIAKMIESSRLNDPRSQVAYKVMALDAPVKLADGQYQIEVIGDLLKMSSSKSIERIPYNLTLTVQAIVPMSYSQANKLQTPDPSNLKQADFLQAIEIMSKDGLQITNIVTTK
jgi:hypothetical protein